jgi:hypothetical protein
MGQHLSFYDHATRVHDTAHRLAPFFKAKLS